MKILLEESQTLNAGWELKNFQLDRPTVSAICTVVRVHGAEEIGYEIAVEFESIDEDHAAEVKKFLEEL
jgi:c-di-GMP-binding flagellar brake protein YcgR